MLILLSTFCAAENSEPFYIVDGKMGVASTELPPAKEIVSVNIVKPEKAISIYGERASGGAIIIKTRKYASEQQAEQKTVPATKHKKNRYSNQTVARGIGILVGVILLFLEKPLKKLASKIQKRINKNRSVTARSYDPGVFDSEGVRFSGSERIGNYISVAFFLILAALIGWLLVHLTRPDTYQYPDEKGVYIFIIIFFAGLLGYFVFCAITFSKLLKCYLIVDEKGIRGVCAEHIWLRIVLRNVEIRWNQVGKAKMMSPLSIDFFTKGLKLPEHFEDFAELAEVEGIEKGSCSVELSGLPTKEVRDAVNFFYARYQNQHTDELSATKMNSYLLPPENDDDKLYQWIVVIIFVILIGIFV